MINNQNESDDGISGIPFDISERIFELWQERKTLREISQELNLPIEIVERDLKRRQKTLIPKGSLKL